ncbi:MAG TPA: hypothetical protein VFS43_39195 [Polyangiaceae bacterium]|nr:hypothetical protein [Polyangiaceae bacterium]
MDNQTLAYWLEQSASLPADYPIKVPYNVALVEAAQAAKFVDEHWEGDGDVPGLKRYEARLPRATSGEIRALIVAVQWQQTKTLLLVDPGAIEIGTEAAELLDELESTVAFVLDDGVDEPADVQLAQIKQYHGQDGQSSGVMAQALRDYSALAESLKGRILEADKGFDVTLIDRGRAMADKLALAPAAVASPTDQARERAARNRLLALLTQKVSLVRLVAGHAFRKHPEIARKVTSAYERRRRTAARKAKAGGGGGGAPAPTSPNPVLE